nr:MAG TPA: hypothetical protein [Caudoviricetes sp.]
MEILKQAIASVCWETMILHCVPTRTVKMSFWMGCM